MSKVRAGNKVTITYLKQGYRIVTDEETFFNETGNLNWEEVKQDYWVVELLGETLVKPRNHVKEVLK